MQNKKISTYIGVFSFVVLTTCVVIIVARDNKTNEKNEATTSSFAENKKGEISIANKTNSLEITNSEIVNQVLRLSLKNISPKSINCLYFTVGEDNTLRYDFAYSEQKSRIASLEIYTLLVPVDDEILIQGLTLRGVLFVDDTGEGETSYVNEMKNIRRGERLIIAEGLRIFQSFLSEPQNVYDFNFGDLKEKFLSLQTTDKAGTNHGIREGKHWGKQKLLHYVEQAIREPGNALSDNRSKMLEFKSKLEKLAESSRVGVKQ
ncbi:MAG TPA: hypothetical protein VGB02_08805 [Pyrinomonadaceae bacterium]|jgi:hypothetical protein